MRRWLASAPNWRYSAVNTANAAGGQSTCRCKEHQVSGRCLRTLASGVGLLVGFSVGCESTGNIWLVQPRLTGWQRELKLNSEQVRWARAGGEDVERILAEFPLPGARTGRPTYLLYLRLPAGRQQVSFEPEASPSGQGFLIQTRGEFAGMVRAIGGSIEIRGKSSADQINRRLGVDLTFEDDSHFVGEIEAFRDDYFVSRFENKRRPGDVAILVNHGSEATTRPQSTGDAER
jgi:hypothetical protein